MAHLREAARATAISLLLVAGVGGCEGVLPPVDLERMIEQRSYRPYEPAPWFGDGRAMRTPPDGTVSRERLLGEPARSGAGVAGREYAESIPAAITVTMLEHGRSRFEIVCANCHGLLGDGVSEVARNMALRQPRSLIAEPVASYPPGRIYRVIVDGYGFMPSHARQLDVADRWAVIAYLRALAVSQQVTLAALPDGLRAQALKDLP